jgi:hypothetical protein
VLGDHPTCEAVGLYRALSAEHTWLVLTSHRLAVLRLRDLAVGTQSIQALAAAKGEKSLVAALRGLGKFVMASASATEFAQSACRPLLIERPRDALLEAVWETPRQTVARVERWKQPLVQSSPAAPAGYNCTSPTTPGRA